MNKIITKVITHDARENEIVVDIEANNALSYNDIFIKKINEIVEWINNNQK